MVCRRVTCLGVDLDQAPRRLVRLEDEVSYWGVAFVVRSDLCALFQVHGGQANADRLVANVAARA